MQSGIIPRANLHDTIFGVIGDDADIGLQRNGQSDSNGMTVDRGDHRFAQFEGGRVDRRRRECAVVRGGVERRSAA
jgi:hypothetical protein